VDNNINTGSSCASFSIRVKGSLTKHDDVEKLASTKVEPSLHLRTDTNMEYITLSPSYSYNYKRKPDNNSHTLKITHRVNGSA